MTDKTAGQPEQAYNLRPMSDLERERIWRTALEQLKAERDSQRAH